jgi:hypothetical protein
VAKEMIAAGLTHRKIDSIMQGMDNFKSIMGMNHQRKNNKKCRTLVFDVENILLTQIEIFTRMQLELTKNHDDFEKDYIMIELPNLPNCCDVGIGCLCNVKLFKLRPNAMAFLQSVSFFYEIICFSKLPTKMLVNICL